MGVFFPSASVSLWRISWRGLTLEWLFEGKLVDRKQKGYMWDDAAKEDFIGLETAVNSGEAAYLLFVVSDRALEIIGRQIPHTLST